MPPAGAPRRRHHCRLSVPSAAFAAAARLAACVQQHPRDKRTPAHAQGQRRTHRDILPRTRGACRLRAGLRRHRRMRVEMLRRQQQEMERRRAVHSPRHQRIARHAARRARGPRRQQLRHPLQLGQSGPHIRHHHLRHRRDTHPAIPQPQHRSKRQHRLSDRLQPHRRLRCRPHRRPPFHRTRALRHRRPWHPAPRGHAPRGRRHLPARQERGSGRPCHAFRVHRRPPRS